MPAQNAYTYVTPAQYALQAQSNAQITLTVPVQKVMQQAHIVTARVEKLKGYTFVPHLRVQHYDARGVHIDSSVNVLLLNKPYLRLDAVRVGVVPGSNGTLLTADVDYAPYPREALPILALQRLTGVWDSDGAHWLQSIRLEGLQGYHSAGEAAWVDTFDTVQNVGGIDATAVQITVDDAGDTAMDANGFAPRFSPGQLLRVDAEYLAVLAVDAENNTLTVKRAQNGTAAAAHAQGAAIETWNVEEDVARACARDIGLRITRFGLYDQASFDGVQATQFPADLLPESVNILRKYPKLSAFGAP